MELFNKLKLSQVGTSLEDRQARERIRIRESSREMAMNILNIHNKVWQSLSLECQGRICTEISTAIDHSIDGGGLILKKSPEKIWHAFNENRGACIYAQDQQGGVHFYRSCLYYKGHSNPHFPSAVETGALIANPLLRSKSNSRIIGYNRNNHATHTPGSCVLEASAILARMRHPNDPIIATVRAPQSILAAHKAGFVALDFGKYPELQALTCTKDCVGNVYQGTNENSINCKVMKSSRNDDCKLLVYNPEVLQSFKNNFNQSMINQRTSDISRIREMLNIQ